MSCKLDKDVTLIIFFNMLYFCTLCDKNYILKGLAMVESLKETMGDKPFTLYWLCLDMATYDLLYGIDPRIKPILLKDLEEADPSLQAAKNNPPSLYGTQYENYCWSLTPYFIDYILRLYVPNGEKLTYVDSDIYFYQSPQKILDVVGSRTIGIHTHRFGGVFNPNIDTGWYNVGVIVFTKDELGLKISNQWKWWLLDQQHEYYKKYGTCGDQKYLELFIPIFGKENVSIFDEEGCIGHYAPWCCDILRHPLYFFHFSHFRHDLANNKWYDALKDEWHPATNPHIRPYYEGYFEKIKQVQKEYNVFV